MAKKKPEDALRELADLERLAVLSDDEQLQQIRRLERDFTKERAKRREAEKKYKHSEKELIVTASNLERMLYAQDNASIRKYESVKKRRTKSKATAIICVNDWHTESTIDPDTIGGVNEFNLEIADRRIKRTWEKSAYLIDFARKIVPIDEVAVWAGGDLINGMIHEELQQSNGLGPGDAILHVQDHLVSGIKYLMKETKCAHLQLLANYGNHGRVNPNKRIQTACTHSWEYTMYCNAARIMESDRSLGKKFSHSIERGATLKQDIQGHRCRFHHGDQLRYSGGVGGLMTPVNKAVAAWNHTHGVAELDVIGHFHQFITTPSFVACGCLCGYDAYAASIRCKAELPSQTMIVMDQDYGKIMTLQIFCEDRTDTARTWSTPEIGR